MRKSTRRQVAPTAVRRTMRTFKPRASPGSANRLRTTFRRWTNRCERLHRWNRSRSTTRSACASSEPSGSPRTSSSTSFSGPTGACCPSSRRVRTSWSRHRTARRDATRSRMHPARATATSSRSSARPAAEGGSVSLVDATTAGSHGRDLRAAQRFRARWQSGKLPVHRRRHRHHADPLDDPPPARHRRQAVPSLLPVPHAGDHRVPRRVRRARVPRQGGRPPRHGRRRPLARPVADAREGERRASVLLRSARPDGGGSRHDRPLVRRRPCTSRISARARTRTPSTTRRSASIWRKRGDTIEIPADKTMLETLRAHGCTIPSSCESGTCGTCRVGLVGGEPDHRDLVLSDRERLREVMVCVSRARSPDAHAGPVNVKRGDDDADP